MMKRISILFFILLQTTGFAQIELAVQKGHSAEIVLLEFSHSNRYLASLGANNEVIIWELSHQKSVASFEINPEMEIQGMKFGNDEHQLLVRANNKTIQYDLVTSVLTEKDLPNDTLYRQKDYYYNKESNYEVEVYDGAIRKKRRDKRFRKYKISVNYLNAPFTAFDVSPTLDLIIGVAEDQKTYVNSFSTGRTKAVLQGHYSSNNDVRFSKDGKYFAVAGKDRSISIWESTTMSLKMRLSTNVFRKKTANFSQDGNRIYVGDELGYIYEIDFRSSFPTIRVAQPNLYPINKIIHKGPKQGDGYYVASSNNYVYYKTNLAASKPIEKFIFRENAFLKAKKRILQTTLKVYQEPFGEPDVLDISPDGKKILYTGKSDNPNVSMAFTENNTVEHFYNYENWKQWRDVGFTSNESFMAISDSSNVLFMWKWEKNKYYLKTDTLPLDIKNFEYLGDEQVWISSYNYGQFIYSLESRKLTKKSKESAENIFKKDRFIIIANESHDLIFFNLVNNEITHHFKGHSDVVTDVNIHPEGRLFVSSSDDGTVKLWSLEKSKVVSTIIPFRNREFVFVTDDNYYMITKGAMNEIGFKYKGQYFNPDQFDLKYNRPDIVLGELGYADSFLIKAYYQAYLKRLKKLNFTEDQLAEDFHLPRIEVKNELTIPSETEESKVVFNLLMTDDKYELDRLNVWVNDVAIHGVDGIDLREEHLKRHELSIGVPLAKGKNKVEVSIMNMTGAQSYKKTILINSSAGKEKPSLYIVSLGVSKHEDPQYNLEFADKDAKDIVATFQKSPFFNEVHAKTYVNHEVTLENLEEIKPFLQDSDINDVVILFVAGHGVLDDQFDYYFASYDMDFNDPSRRGIAYGAIEKLLDGIPALKKLLFIDTCHSGELDKEEVEETIEDQNEDGELIFRRVGRTVNLKENPLGLKSTNELMKSLFTDLRRGTGATVISSSGGAEYSIEGGAFKNGLFTYCMINGLTNRKADLNKDGQIDVSELQLYVQKEVNELSGGLQTPTSRIQNSELDYRLW
jgi:WD40 repeat protein